MSNMSKEFAGEVQGRLDAGYTLEQALQPLFTQIVLDQKIIIRDGKPISLGLMFDRLEEVFVVAISTSYASDGVTPIWFVVSQKPELAIAYGVYLELSKPKGGEVEEYDDNPTDD